MMTTSTIARYAHVCAFRSPSTGGFDWYRSQPAADQAFEKVREHVIAFQGEGWEAFRFDVEVPAHLTDGEVTNLIDADFDEHCDTAKQRGRSFACTERRAATA